MSSNEKPLIQIVEQEGEHLVSKKQFEKQVKIIPNTVRDRYASFHLIPWWEQERLRKATLMVVGAGALGNEVLKNLALMGVGRIFIVDFDVVEPSNLSRGILFRSEDSGRSKAEVAASAVKAINPDVQVQAFHGDISTDIGLGVFKRMDVIIGCLDNREARLTLNKQAYRLNKPWVDGAIQELLGIARVFWPGRGACYECTLTREDWEEINLRYSCSLINREKMLEGKVPTTPTIASIIAAIQTQEALKILHSLPVQAGKGFIFNGLNNFTYQVEYPVRKDCMGHDIAYGVIEELPDASTRSTTLAQLLALARKRLGPETQLELDFELATEFHCLACDTHQPVFQPLQKLDAQAARCPTCGRTRYPVSTHIIYGNEPYLDYTLASLGVPPFHILVARSGQEFTFLELTKDVSLFCYQ